MTTICRYMLVMKQTHSFHKNAKTELFSEILKDQRVEEANYDVESTQDTSIDKHFERLGGSLTLVRLALLKQKIATKIAYRKSEPTNRAARSSRLQEIDNLLSQIDAIKFNLDALKLEIDYLQDNQD